MPKIERICKVCQNTFLVDPSRLKHGRGQTCSRPCQYKSNRRRVPVTCAQCGMVFEVRQADYDYRVSIGEPPTYCSRRCAHDSPTWKENLGQSLRVSPAAAAARVRSIAAMNADAATPEGRERRRKQTERQMSDPALRSAWLDSVRRRSDDPAWQASPQFRRGVAHAKYRGNKKARETAKARYEYQTWRTAVFTRDDFTCQECRMRGVRLHAHHVKPWADFPELRLDIANGVTLCERCHRAMHAVSTTPGIHDHTPGT